ncbi:TPA: AI-2E family transporter [Candidatus Pacearchaeota archaeon]|jgi:predicted PurR-regulated permease PerM|nr:AI-2E family transporter [Candidatus Pacearchaeota archaeon]
MKKEDLSKYIPVGVIFLLILISFLMIRSFLIPLISAFILAYLLKPVYDKLKLSLPKEISAIICIFIVITLIFAPLIGLISGIVNQASGSLNSGILFSFLKKASETTVFQTLNLDLSLLMNKTIEFLISILTNITLHIPSFIITTVITSFGMYYLLIDWKPFTKKLIKYLPSTDKEALAKDISKITKNLIYGTLLVSLVEFIIALAGFWISGVQYFLLLPTIIAIFAFIPGLGPTIVWVPLFIIELIQQNYFTAIGVLITGLILSIGVDIIFRAKISGRGAKTHPLIILVGILGGISLFGIFGFIIGPLILSYAIEILEEIAEGQ